MFCGLPLWCLSLADFLATLVLLKRAIQYLCVQIFCSSYAWFRCSCFIHLLVIWLSALASLGRARREGIRATVSSLLTSTCHQGPSGCVLAGSPPLNPPPLKKKALSKMKHFNRFLLSFPLFPLLLSRNKLAADLCTSDS